MSQNMPADTGFVCDKPAVIRDNMTGKQSIRSIGLKLTCLVIIG